MVKRWGFWILLVTAVMLSGCGSPRIGWEHEPMGGPYPGMDYGEANSIGEYTGYPNYPEHQTW